eukprot:m.35386 g.35386  ORF g.35386 m.35386 type:complete len:308 (+) comp32104_c0_seq5:25-948(+)
MNSKVLLVGIVCWDIVSVCDHFPGEDEDIRALRQRWDKGGNAANSLAVLGQFGVDCELLATVAKGPETDFVLEELKSYGVNVDRCVFHDGKRLPNSQILINRVNGSRTIVHYRDLPELSFADFESKVNLDLYMWIHFQGRNVDEVLKMIYKIQAHNSSLPDGSHKIMVSIEIEKIAKEILTLLPEGDVMFISKQLALHHGCTTAQEALGLFSKRIKQGTKLICAWGEKGAFAIEKDSTGNILISPAFPPPTVIDTLAAGDTFNASVIYSLSKGRTLQEAITLGCKVAGKKCGQDGQRGLIDKTMLSF